MGSMDVAFGQGAKNIAESLSQSTGRASSVVTHTLTRMNEWTKAGWSAIPHKRALGIGSAVGIGIAVALSEPGPSLNMGGSFVQPQMQSGSGGSNIPDNVHPMPQAVGQPSAPDLTGMGNRAHISPNFRVNISARAIRHVDTQSLSNEIRGALGGNAHVNTRVSDQRSSLTPQSIADTLGGG